MSADQQLVAVCGLPGVGKSSVAEQLTERLGGIRLRTDAVRKELVDEPTYSAAETERVYDAFVKRAKNTLKGGYSVILDATFRKQSQRERVHRVAADESVQFTLIHVVCDDDIVEQRIRIRDDISDADVDVFRQLKSEFEPIELDHERIDNSGTREETAEQVSRLF